MKIPPEFRVLLDEALEAGDASALVCADLARGADRPGQFSAAERYQFAAKAQRWEKARRHLMAGFFGAVTKGA